MRILTIKGQSQYGGTRLFADEAAAAFGRQGHAVEVLDVGDVGDAGPRILAHAPTARADLIFTINIGGEFSDSQGRTLSDLYGAPHVVWHTDYIFSQLARLKATPKSTAVLLVDPTQVEGVKSLYGEDRFDHIGFFPHPGVGAPAPDDTTAAEFIARRPIAERPPPAVAEFAADIDREDQIGLGGGGMGQDTRAGVRHIADVEDLHRMTLTPKGPRRFVSEEAGAAILRLALDRQDAHRVISTHSLGLLSPA